MDAEGEKNDAGRSGTVGAVDPGVGRALEGEAVIGSDVAVLVAAVVMEVAGNDEPAIGCVRPATTAPPFLSQGFGGETIVANDQSSSCPIS